LETLNDNMELHKSWFDEICSKVLDQAVVYCNDRRIRMKLI
jgi:hypothetical protein